MAKATPYTVEANEDNHDEFYDDLKQMAEDRRHSGLSRPNQEIRPY